LETLKSIRENPTTRGGEETFSPVEIMNKQEPFHINTHAQRENVIEPDTYTSFQMTAQPKILKVLVMENLRGKA